MRLWEPYAGSLGITRAAVGVGPLIAYMGRKDKLAPHILKALDCTEPDALFINDCGLWGDVWNELLLGDAEGVVTRLEAWGEVDRCDLWTVLATIPVADKGSSTVAQFLYLQARSIRGIPLYWYEGRWICHRADGSIKAATQRQAPIPGKGGGGLTALGLAARVRALMEHTWPPTHVRTERAIELPWHRLAPGDRVYLDPPYAGCTPYQGKESRRTVLALAARCAKAGAHVAISEAVPLANELGSGAWEAIDLTAEGHGSPEWLTVCHP